MKNLNAKEKKYMKKCIEIIKMCVCRGRKKPREALKNPKPKKQKLKKNKTDL